VLSAIGHYRILEKLGAGGMGEVYRAEDSKLGRKVALKILPPELAQSAERLQRFESEARAVAALNHPNIVTVHSVEEADGIRFITMELIRGKTLTAVFHRTTLREFFDIGLPLADALSAAHQQGIVHRDLKPDNVMLTDEGRVKILDFGLAKFKPRTDSESFASHLPTKSMTSPGVIVGTVAYMSPEQAEGKGVDHRSDIFSLGIILYQLLSGRHPFSGDSAASVLSGILKDTPPPLSELNPGIPYELARVVRRCLEKSPARRYQSALDLRNDLEEVKADFESGAIQKRSVLPAPTAPLRKFLPWVLAAILGAAAVATDLLSRTSDVPAPAIRRFVVRPPAESRLTGDVSLSPDGSRLLFRATQGDRNLLYLQSLDQFAPRPLEGTDGANEPFISPDGDWVGFAAEGKLKKVPLSGGDPVTLCDVADVIGANWGEDGNIVFGSINSGLRQVSAEGGEPRSFLEPDTERGELDFHYPQILPGGGAMLITRHDKSGVFGIEVYSFATKERKRLLEDAFYGRFTPTGHLVYGRGYSLFAAPFDLGRMEVSGTSVLVGENVFAFPESGYVSYAMADDGTLVYVPRPSRDGRSLVWVDRNGKEEPLPMAPRAFSNPRLSPDGKQLAVSIEDDGRHDVWVFDLERDTEHRVTFEGQNESPIWTPDGSRLTFASGQNGARNLFWKPADGSGVAERLTESDLRQWPLDWSPDGKTLAFMETDPTDYWSLSLLRLDAEPRVEPLTRTRGRHNKPRFSPDGRWIAYSSNEEIYIQPFPGPGGPRQISTNGGVEAIWAPNGRELFYRSPSPRNEVTQLAVQIETSPSVRSGRPETLFEGRYAGTFYGASYDIAPDGRFLMIKPSEDEVAPLRIQLVQGWFEELKRRVPASSAGR
jgi:serine/threonine-protein kinase